MHLQRLRKHGVVGPAESLVRASGTGSVAGGYLSFAAGGAAQLEHRIVMARLIGRPLRANEHVHHRNGNGLDNRPRNLELWTRSHPNGQRVDDLIAWALEAHPALVRRAHLDAKPRDQAAGIVIERRRPSICCVEACGKTTRAKGLCGMHYERQRRTGTTDGPDRGRRTPATCSVEGCDRALRAKGLCSMHYDRVRNHGNAGSADPILRYLPRECGVAGCSERHFGKGWCGRHYKRWLAHGDPAITLLRSVCSVEGCDRDHRAHGYCSMHVQRWRANGIPGAAEHCYGAGSIDSDGYRVHSVNGRKVLEHRLVMEGLLGRSLRASEQVHHRNGDRLDNHPENLELWVRPQPAGQRVSDLVAWLTSQYPRELGEALATTSAGEPIAA